MHIKPMRPFFSNMFRLVSQRQSTAFVPGLRRSFGHKTLDVITLFKSPVNSAASTRIHNMLKMGSATASETATEDQAADHSAQTKHREPFELDISDAVPTEDQLRSIAEYAGEKAAGGLVEGASSVSEAVRKLASGGKLKVPVVVDWSNGKAVIGDDESAIKKMLQAQN